MRKLTQVTLFLFGLFWTPEQTLAQVTCDTGGGLICVEAEQTDTGVTLYGQNNFALLPVTLTLDVTVQNLQRIAGSQDPIVLPAGDRRALISYTTKKLAPWRYDYKFEWSRGDINARHDPAQVYQLPYASGQSFTIVQGCNGSFTHQGKQRFALDFDFPEGTPVLAARAGQVVDLRSDSRRGGPTPEFQNDANFIYIEHEDGTLGNYVHFQPAGVVVVLGEWVEAGDLLGYSGNTGWSTGPHLHFSVDIGGPGLESQSLPITLQTARGLQSCPARGRTLRKP